MRDDLTSRRPWRAALLLATLTIGSALILWLTPPALARPPVPHPTSTPPAPPAADCQTRWCEQVRRVRRITRRVDRYLASIRSPMPAWALVRAGREAGISPFALAAISVVESSAGLAACGRNAWGLGACSRAWTTITLCGKRWTLATITSWYAGARMTGELIRCLWPRARSVYDLHGYCSGCSPWPGAVASVMRRMGSGPGVRWAHAQAAVR